MSQISFYLAGPDNAIKKFAGDAEKGQIEFSFILEDTTTGFIETDVYLTDHLPQIIRDVVDPLFKMTDVGLSTILISVEEKNIEKINEVAKSNKVFVVEFNKILEEE